jgi:hypothetical protein
MGNEISVADPGSGSETSTGGTSVTISNVVPTNSVDGNLWLDTNTGILYVYINDGDSEQWIQPIFPYPDITGLATENYVDAAVSRVTATSIGLGNVTNESKATMFTSPTFTGTATFSKSTEIYFLKTGATGTVVHDFAESAIWSHENMLGNFTANFTNVPTTSGRIIVVTLLLVQGLTPRIPNAVQINGVPQTILWQGGIEPTGTAIKGELVSFTLIKSTLLDFWTVAGSLTSYG